MDKANTLLRLKAVLDQTNCYGPVPESNVNDAEKILGVSFPTSYRLFLMNFGASWFIPPYEIAGLPSTRSTDEKPPMWTNVIDITEAVRRIHGKHIPNHYVAQSDDGCEYHYYLETGSMNPEGECPVVVLAPGCDGEVVADSFLEFVERIASGEDP